MTNAKWIEYPRAHYFKCSNCRYTVPYRKAFLRNDGKREYNYCPSCGAFMRYDGCPPCYIWHKEWNKDSYDCFTMLSKHYNDCSECWAAWLKENEK